MATKIIGPFEYVPADHKADKCENAIVLIFGWSDGEARLVKKYSSIYHAKGLDVLCMTSRTSDVLSSRRINSLVKRNDYEIVRFLEERKVLSGATRLIVQVFSNGGCHSYRLFYESLSAHPSVKNCSLKVSHLIIDSAPGVTDNIWQAASGMTTWVKTKWLLPIATFIAVLILGLMRCVEIIIGLFSASSDSPFELQFYKNIVKFFMQQNTPRLFLYTEEDKLVPHKKIEDHLHSLKKKGIAVQHKKFENSGHVQHYRYHKNDYENSIWEFISNVHD